MRLEGGVGGILSPWLPTDSTHLAFFLPQVFKLTASAPQLPTEQPCSEQAEMQDGDNDIHEPPSGSQERDNGFTTAVSHHHIYPTLPTHDSGEEKEREKEKGEERKIKSEQKKVTFSASPSSKVSRLVDSDSSSLSGNTGPFVTAAQSPDEMEDKVEFPPSSSSPGPAAQPSRHLSPSSSSSPTVPVNYAIQHLSESKTTVMRKKTGGVTPESGDRHSPKFASDSQNKGGASQLGKKRKGMESLSSPLAAKRSRAPPTQDTTSGILQPPLLPHPHLVTPPLLPSTPPQPSSESWLSQLFKRKPTPK